MVLARIYVLLLLFLAVSPMSAQTQPVDGLRTNPTRTVALTNARIIVSPGVVIERGTIVVREGVIVDVGAKVVLPPGASPRDLNGLTLTPGFIDLSSSIGMPRREPSGPTSSTSGVPPIAEQPPAGPVDWNAKVRAHVSAAAEFRPDEKTAEKLRSQGFVLALTQPSEGIFAGSAALVWLGQGTTGSLVRIEDAAQVISLNQTGSFLSGYPNSLMGIIAHIRQTLIDAGWYRLAWEAHQQNPSAVPRPEVNHALARLDAAVRGRQPVVIGANDEWNLLRASKIAREFGLNLWVDGSGKEFRRLAAVRASGVPVILPLNFPETPSVASPDEALNVTLEDLREWDAAPENPARLHKAGVTIALTARDLKDPATFLAQLKSALQRGLPESAALAALTTTPARLLGIGSVQGTLEKGKSASFIISDGSVFEARKNVREVWVAGVRHDVTAPPDVDVRGTWDMTMTTAGGETRGTLTLKGEVNRPAGTLATDRGELSLSNVSYDAGRFAFTTRSDTSGDAQDVRQFSGTVSGRSITGVWQTTERDEAGTIFGWSALRTAEHTPPPEPEKDSVVTASFPDSFPLGAFGRPSIPPLHGSVLFKGATVWTMGKAGRLENADVLIRNGKVERVGRGLDAPSGAVVVDARGKHLTPGLIDGHSHTGVSGGVNEGGQSITCEVRIADVLDPDNIWIYRQLAGGTTAANILHGSANPIGGQNAVVKWRWGALADDLLIRGAPQGVKFALGENVKRSHFSQPGRPARYPRTRMGVEQLIRDRFRAALEYDAAMKAWSVRNTGLPPRRDLELEAIVEMLAGSRLIHAHSYRQDEILMLLRVAEEFGVRIATFQHILEGYKVADQLARHGAGASGFSDWWSYKWEAYDAIPGNIPLMHRQGVLVSYNSDNAQLATRLNWEAAKGVEFGMTDEEALATVTINVAKQFGIDRMTGSIEPGKDADIAVWSGHPLSTRSICVQTWVDGRRYFDIEEDRTMRMEAEQQRAVLMAKALKEKRPAGPSGGTARTVRRPNETYLESCSGETDHE